MEMRSVKAVRKRKASLPAGIWTIPNKTEVTEYVLRWRTAHASFPQGLGNPFSGGVGVFLFLAFLSTVSDGRGLVGARNLIAVFFMVLM